MITEIRLHGKVGERLDYFVTIAGADLSGRYCYESLPEGDRFFSGGSEFIVSSEGISHRGSGGSLCEYMFGVDLPLTDLMRKDVLNRLVMYGAYYDEAGDIVFTGDTAGRESFDQVFLSGNAVTNYFFFVHPSRPLGLRDLQRDLLRTLGKLLKRTASVGRADDSRLCRDIFDAYGDPRALVFLIRLVNQRNEGYFKTFHSFYTGHKTLTAEAQAALDALAQESGIIPYQQERIKIDGMYKLPENKKIVDEYKDILIGISEKGEANAPELARLSRLRTLSLRFNIPHNLFDTLDELLLKNMPIVAVEEPAFVRDTRAIFEGLFFRTDRIKGQLSDEDLEKLLKAKQKSTAARDQAFQGLLLDTVRACDEHARDTNDMTVLESMSSILTYFDRYDTVASTINNLAFMEGVSLGEDAIRSLSRNQDIFDEIRPGLFRELFLDPLRENLYLTRYGRKKIDLLMPGLMRIKAGDATHRDIAAEIDRINANEKLYGDVHRYVKERFKSIYADMNSREDQDVLIRDFSRELQARGIVDGPVPRAVFEEIILDIRKESFYLNNLLPHIIVSRDRGAREDFLINSGLDRYYIEELEKDYFAMNNIEQPVLEQIRQ